MQYNRPEALKNSKFAPYPLQLSQARVTDENAAVTFLAPDHPALTTPNKITTADFEGWVQERGIYYPGPMGRTLHADPRVQRPGRGAAEGRPAGREAWPGHFVYTGLVFFRQLPAGVPGAYRLFANLVSLGK